MSKKTAEKTTDQDQNELDFESALAELEGLVEQLEAGDLGLADSLQHFEKGVMLSRRCHALLDDARQKVSLLTDPENEASETDFKQSNETSD
ncbi:MAG: exodeoxyribonuclease VII small subunit [Pseudomonadota bacterium]